MKEPHVVAMKQAPLKAQKPTEEEVEIGEVFAAPDQAPTTGNIADDRQPASADRSYRSVVTRNGPRSAIRCRESKVAPTRANFIAVGHSTEDKLAARRQAATATRSDLGAGAVKNISGGLNALLADVFALYVKTKNFHWHMSGPHFRDYHLLLDEQAEQIFAMTDDIAERVRKIGGTTIRSIGHIARLQRLSDNDAEYVDPLDMLAELREDNRVLLAACARLMIVRRRERCRYREPVGEVDRRDGTVHLVPL